MLKKLRKIRKKPAPQPAVPKPIKRPGRFDKIFGIKPTPAPEGAAAGAASSDLSSSLLGNLTGKPPVSPAAGAAGAASSGLLGSYLGKQPQQPVKQSMPTVISPAQQMQDMKNSMYQTQPKEEPAIDLAAEEAERKRKEEEERLRQQQMQASTGQGM